MSSRPILAIVALLAACELIEPEPEYAWALQPVKLSPDHMVVATGDVIYVRHPFEVRSNYIPQANRWSDYSYHELDRCLLSGSSPFPENSCSDFEDKGWVLITAEMADSMMVHWGCGGGGGGSASNSNFGLTVTSCLNIRRYGRGQGPGLDYNGAKATGWLVVGCGPTWISYSTVGVIGSGSRGIIYPIVAALSDTISLTVPPCVSSPTP